MRFHRSPSFLLYALMGVLSAIPLQAQTAQTAPTAQKAEAPTKPRVAVYPFDDRTTANKDMNIGAKVADLLIAKLTANGAFTVYDRQYVDKILAENHRKYDPNYDSVSAAKTGLLGTVELVVAGQIDAYSAEPKLTDTKAGPFATRQEVTGVVSLKVTARLISVEQGSITAAPTAPSDPKGINILDESTPI